MRLQVPPLVPRPIGTQRLLDPVETKPLQLRYDRQRLIQAPALVGIDH